MQAKASMSDAQIEEAARMFGALAEPTRLRLLRALMGGPHTVTELVEATGLKQGNVSKQLGILLAARFVAKEKEGNFARYSLADPTLYMLCDLVCGRIESLAALHLQSLSPKTVTERKKRGIAHD
ncbi:MAG TPA: metalloregulator ArsR/SmtB family transcription factor [Chthoniobacterales bacterium]